MISAPTKTTTDDIVHSPRLVHIITGPTASGKSDRALALAHTCAGTLINLDSVQCYADVRILSARPDDAQLQQAPHCLYGFAPAAPPLTTADRLRLINAAIDQAIAHGRRPILVGGSGTDLWLLRRGLIDVPPIDPQVRQDVRRLTSAAAAEALAREDPIGATRLHRQDTQRVMRALEVIRSTGYGLSAWQAQTPPGFLAHDALQIEVLRPPRAMLHARIHQRFEAMLAAGAIDEAAALNADDDLPIMKTIGVRELRAYAAGRVSLEQAVADALTATRQYAKRQLTRLRDIEQL